MKLGKLLNCYRVMERLVLRDVAKDIGVSASTLSRFENGKGIDSASFAKLLVWLTAKQ